MRNALRILLIRSEKITTGISFHQNFHITSAMSKNKIPDRWEDYEAIGKVVKGTRFIAFKVPLKQSLSCRLSSKEKWFTPKDLPAAVRKLNFELGLVIDLTNTKRYYEEQEITSQGIDYKKIFTEGHSVPSKKVQKSFFEAVDDFLNLNQDNGRVIGVHCTHGLNRTGYLICRYMIDRLKIAADDAINAFNTARGHDMERTNYLDDLRGQPNAELEKGDETEQRGRKRMTSHDADGDESGATPRPSKLRQRMNASNNYNHDASLSSYDHNIYTRRNYHTESSHRNRYENGAHSSGDYRWNPRQGPQNYGQTSQSSYDRNYSYNRQSNYPANSYSNHGRGPYSSGDGRNPRQGPQSYYGSPPTFNNRSQCFDRWGQSNWSGYNQERSDYGQFGRRNSSTDKGRSSWHHAGSQHWRNQYE